MSNDGSAQTTTSASHFDSIIEDFETAVSTLTDVLQFIEDKKPEPRLRVVIINNTIVALTSTIEEALRGLFQEYLSILQRSFKDYGKLRLKLQLTNIDCAIQDMKKNMQNGGLDAVATVATVVSNLAKCLNGQTGYQLLQEQLVYNKGNFKSKQVTDIAKNVGYSNLWEQVCACAEVEEFTSESIVATRVTKLIAQWNDVFEERDLLVHRISQSNGWGPSRIQQAIDLSKLVVKRIAICLTDDTNQLINAYSVPNTSPNP